MYIVLNKINGETAVIKEKSPLARHIGMSIRNIYRKVNEKMFETDGFIVYKADVVLLKSNRGGGKGGNLFKKKTNGISD